MTGYKGVSFHAGRSKPYKAEIRFGGKSYYLGWFASPDEAAVVVDDKLKELYGSEAKLNFPTP